MRPIAHVAIGCHDLDSVQSFYVDKLGARLGRRMDDRITMDFHGIQLVCHLAAVNKMDDPTVYPRHFGLMYRHRAPYEAMLERIRAAGIEPFHGPTVRFKGRKDETEGTYILDPAGNVLEFKVYRNPDVY